TATFTPSANLDFNTIYTATITTGVRDLAGNAMTSNYILSFDTTQPIVISTSPVNGAAGVAINSNITATFSEAMQSSTINTDTFTVSNGSGNIGGTVSYSGTTATFTPSANLDFNTIYTATI
ncbi:MAG: Ig-like domain-containing protein, partial [Candidatus Brocadiales bacterium]|nr:Ig-like domain-containing protein [Candidatus Brocadiales bacterium]